MVAIMRKELADYFNGIRVPVLFLLVLLASAAGLYAAFQGIRQALTETSAITENSFVFLRLFTSSGPIFLFLVGLFVPIIGIALGFDAINSEHSGGTMSRLLSQPVYRDSVINGKFLAGIITLSIMMTTMMMLVSGYGLRMIGVPPTAEEFIRLFIYLVITIVYGAFWMGVAMLFSVLLRKVAASLLLSIAVWLLCIFMLMIAPAIANAVAPTAAGTEAVLIRNAELTQMLLRFSPIYLFVEAIQVLLLPMVVGSLGYITTSQAAFIVPNPLNLGQSLVLIWPHLTSLVGLSVVCFAVSYVLFMRQEIRAT